MSGLDWSDPAPFAPEKSLGAALLTPTRIYVRSCLAAIRETGAVKALAHITGGGLVENIPRVLPAHLAAEIDLTRIDVPPVFRWLARPVAQQEMLRTFNCGVGMILVVDCECRDQRDGRTAAAWRGDRGTRRDRAARRMPPSPSRAGSISMAEDKRRDRGADLRARAATSPR